ncbi:uncharacterized protein BP5553_03645 [Venustampulla echinocandica]|uniref:Myb-like domain-containing protein n=1 Tax=Venustampulla echinocandica TaxID=2656787 RepID=A0A370TUT9_9HELO|nr:uncharacterized protein BP5553_03645 [Venustampulla echinocandica]RDL39305.1 hypothetical protein BP5553_03645 [Venustampulla echinocandica]
MLKNRSKAFAPKFKGGPRRPPANPSSAESSARPSVEPHSQTPAAESSTNHDILSVPEQVTAPPSSEEETRVVKETLRPESNEPSLQAEKSPSAPEVRVESSIRSLKRKEREHDVQELPAKRVPVEMAPGGPTTQDPLSEIAPLSHLENGPREEPSEPAVSRRATPPTVDRLEPNEFSVAHDVADGSGDTPPGYHTLPSSTDLEASISQAPKETTDYPEPVAQPGANLTTPESDSQVVAAADEIQHSRSSSPQSDHEPPRFRYPTPPNTQTLSAIDLPIVSATSNDLSGLGPAGDTGALAQPGHVAQLSQIVPMAGLNPDGTAAALVEEPASGTEKGKKKKKIVRRKKVQAAHEGDDVRATVDMQLNRPRRVAGQKRSRKKKDSEKKRRVRAQTPEGAEDEVVDHTTMKMVDLCKDLRIGKKFSKHHEIKERLVQKKVKAKLAKENPELISLVEGEQHGKESSSRPDEDASGLAAAPSATVQMRVVDGQIVVDENTLQVDRQERGRAERGEVVEEVEEDDFTTVTTSGTFMKRERAVIWDAVANEMFYNGLAQFGTDFEMIAKLFPSRNRRQIKLKFNKEERNNPAKITRALTGEKISINLDEYEELAGFKLLDVAVIEAERAKIEQEQNAEEARHAADIAETTRRKKADIHAKSDAVKRALSGYGDDEVPAQGTDSAKENAEPAMGKNREASAAPKSKKKVTKKKNPHSSNAGGEEIEVLGSIEN